MAKRQMAWPHVTIQKVAGYDEYCVRYRGLKPDRSEAMAYYTDDYDDAKAVAEAMEGNRLSQVFHSDIKDRSVWSEYFTPGRIM